MSRLNNGDQGDLKGVIYDKKQKLSDRMRAVDNLGNETDIKEIADWIGHPTLICKALINKNLRDKAFVEKFLEHKNEKIQEVAGVKLNQLNRS